MHPSRHPATTGTLAHAAGFFASTARYLKARLTLATLEAREAGAHYGIAAGMAVGALFVAVLGYVFLVITAVFAVAAMFESRHAWIWVMGGAALLHLAGAGALVFLAWQRVKTGAFTATLEEFKKDQQWLTDLTNHR